MLYTPVSVLIGLILTADAISLLKDNGQTSKLNSAASTIEVVWLVISLVYLLSESLYGLSMLVPIFFVSYVLAGFISSFLMVRHVETAEEVQEMKIPRSYIYVALGFGLLFSFSNVLVMLV